MKRNRFNRIISFMLALIIVCANLTMPAWSVESSQSFSEAYEDNVGGTAKLNTNAMIYISDDPTVGLNFQNVLMPDEIAEYADMVFAIVDCYIGNGGYWYKLDAMDGQTLPAVLQSMPWIYQNDITDMGYADALIITPPSQPSEPDNGFVDQATGIKVFGDLPEGAELKVTVPKLNGEELSGAFDIKIYDANGNEWQPIDEGKTVTISFPVGYDKTGLYHIVDHHNAIAGRSDLTLVPVAEIEDQGLLQLLEPAMDAYEAVYGNRDYVAIEEMEPVSAQNGMASFEVNSFSIYIPFDGSSHNAGDDWESYTGYKTVEEANAAIADGTARVYKFQIGQTFKVPFNKGLGQSDYTDYYNIYYGDGINNSPSINTSYVSATLTDRSGFIVYNYKNIQFEAEALTNGQYVYIRYFGGPESSNKYIIVQVVETIENPTEPNGVPLYVGIDPNIGNDFYKEPLTVDGMKGKFYWYLNGGLNTDKNTIKSYADNSNMLFACNSFENSILKQTDGNVSAIIDYAGILTRDFINVSETFVDEIVTKMNVDMDTHTLLIYAVKATYDNDGNPTGYYIMCKLKEKSSSVISYYSGTPYGFNESDLSEKIPPVQIVVNGSTYTVEDIDRTNNAEGVFETSDGSNDYKIRFLGWSSEPNSHYEDWPDTPSEDDHWYKPGDNIYPTEDMQLYAVWEPENHYNVADIKFTCKILDENGEILDDGRTVRFEVDSRFTGYDYVIYNEMGVPYGGVKKFTGADIVEMAHGDFLFISQVPTLENDEDPYLIVCVTGGYYESEAAAKTEFWITKAENSSGLFEKVFTAQLQSYILTWDVDGQRTEKEYHFGDAVEKCPDPAKNGYTFVGWSVEVPETMPSNDLIISATWSINTYNVTYDLDGGSGTAPTVSYTIEDPIVLPSSGLQKSGYAFNGWVPTSNVGSWKTSTTYNGTLSDMYGDITLKAKWVEKEYTITYDYAGGALPSGTPYIGGYQTGDTVELYEPIREGYEFNGWKVTSTNGSWQQGKIYEKNESVSGVIGNVTLTAQWTPITYTITYNFNGGIGNGVYITIYTVETEDIQIPNPTKQENEFLGWTGTGLSEATRNLVIPKGSIGNREYTATWGLNQYSITLVFDNGREPQTRTVDYGSTVTLPNPNKDGYLFGGWRVTSTDGEWSVGDVYTSEMTALSGNVTLNAVWMPIEYTITFNTNGGSAVAPITQGYGTPVTAPMAPVKIGYTFVGWDIEIPSTMPAEDLTVTAIWSINQYTVTFKDGDAVLSTVTQNYGTPVAAPADPTKEGYRFSGWDREVPSTMPAEDLTITATWEASLTSLTISVSGGQGYAFVFRIEDDNGLDMLVVVNGGASVTVKELTTGAEYTITELSEWSWRHNVNGATSVTLTGTNNNITFNATSNGKSWLGGEGIG